LNTRLKPLSCMLWFGLVVCNLREHFIDPNLEVPPDVLNWVEIRGVRRLIEEPSDRPVYKLVLNFIGSVYRYVVLHKHIPYIQVLKNRPDFCLQDLKVGIGRVSILRGLKIPVYDIATTLPKVPKGSPDHNLHVLIHAICLNHGPVPFLCRCTKAPFCPFAPPPLHWILVTLADQSPLLVRPPSMREAPSKTFDSVFF